MASIIRQYLVQGILISNIVQDGGQQCYRQIPKQYHMASIILFIAINCLLLKKYFKHLINDKQVLPPSPLQKIMAIINILSWTITFYYKLVTKKAIFMFNPCHVTLIIQTILLLSKNTSIMQKIHMSWTTWLFGAYLAIFMPHLYGLDQFQIVVYYVEHIAIIPFGYIILNKRYGFAKPNFWNQFAGFSSFAIYQLGVLAPISILSKGNLNFALCHSPADPVYKIFGYHYFSIHNLTLNLASFVFRYLSYYQIKSWQNIVRGIQFIFKFKINKKVQ